MTSIDPFTAKVVADIEGQNWTDRPLTENERHLIWMAVRSTLAHSQLAEAAAFIDGLASRFGCEHIAADCREVAAKLRGKVAD